MVFYFRNLCNVFLWWQSWISSIITPVFRVTWSFINNINTMIWYLRNISYYYQCWKQLCCLTFLWKPWYIFMIIWWIKSSKEQHLVWNRNNIIHVFTVTFDQLMYVSFLLATCIVVYNSCFNCSSTVSIYN